MSGTIQNHIAISFIDSSCRQQAIRLAKRLQLPLVAHSSKDYDYLLTMMVEHLELRYTHSKMNPLCIDFLDASLLYRTQKQTGELLMRAVGAKNKSLSVLDATAGLGQDAFLMASFGCKVTMLERSPILYELLKDGLQRYKLAQPDKISLRLLHADAISYLSNELKTKPDIIYLDPMFPHRTKSALVKKEMRFLRDIVGEDPDTDQLLSKALAVAKKRVIVKRPRLAPYLANKKPDFSQTGKSCRFDVYLVT